MSHAWLDLLLLIIIDMNPVELKYCLVIICLNKCSGSCFVLSPKVFVLKETKYINVK